MKKKVLATMMAAALAVSALAGCGESKPAETKAPETKAAEENKETEPAAPAEAGDTFKLGLVCPLSGSSAVSGTILLNAVQMAVNEINEAGGIAGQVKIELVNEDDEATPATSVTVMQKLVEQDKVNAVIGSQPSSCTLANMEITEAAKIPQITPASSNVTVTQQGDDYIYRMTSTDATNAKTLLKYAQSLGYTKIGILNESSDFGTGGAKILTDLAGDYGITVVDQEIYNSGDTDFTAIIGKVDAAGVDAYFIWGYHTETAAIMSQMQQYGYEYPVIGYGMNSPELTALGGDAVEGICICTSFDAANPDETTQAFDKKYMELYGTSYDQNGPQSYDAVYLIADAVERAIKDGANWADGEVLNGYIASASYTGVTGTTSFDETGDMVKDLMIITIENGAHKIVDWQ